LRQRLATTRQVRQLERRRFSAERQACRLLAFVELEFVQAFLQLLEPQQQPPILSQQLPAEPTTDEDHGPSQGKSEDRIVEEHFFWFLARGFRFLQVCDTT
jgi:hypothetical protein